MKKLSLDPGLSGTGYALWDGQPEAWKELAAPIKAGVITSRGKEWTLKARDIAEQLSPLMDEVDSVYAEFPIFFDNPGGHMVAKEGSLEKLGFLIGVMAELAWEKGADFVPVMVNDWKGHLSKERVNIRIRRILRGHSLEILSMNESHDWDATGIGLYAKGYF